MTDDDKVEKRRERNRQYYHEHKERERERWTKWYEKNKENRREYCKSYYAEHREEILAKTKAKYWADPEQAREDGKVKWQKWIQNHPEFKKFKLQYNRHWRANNPEKVRRHNRNYYLKHQDEMIEYRKQWYRENPDKVQGYRRKRREKLRAERESIRLEKMGARKALFESRLRNIPKPDVLDRIRDLLEWRWLRRSLRMTSFNEKE